MCCPLPFPPPQAGEGQGGGSGRARKARQKSLASVGVSPPTFSFVLTRSFLSVRHPCRSGAFQCFHRHWLAALAHGAPNEIGDDGFQVCCGLTRAQKRVARTLRHCDYSPPPPPRGEGERRSAASCF